jgi:hypothetical protein
MGCKFAVQTVQILQKYIQGLNAGALIIDGDNYNALLFLCY